MLRKPRGGAVVSDRISVDGCPVGYMERGKPSNELDSGWTFVAGDEDDATMHDAGRHAVFDLNTVANFDRDVVPLLDATIGSAFARRTPEGPLERVRDGEPPRFRLVSGDYAMTNDWSVTLPGEFSVRIEDESLVLWRPAHTLWTLVWGLPPGVSRASHIEHLLAQCDSDSKAKKVEQHTEAHRHEISSDEERDGAVVHTLHGFVVGAAGYVQMTQYLDIVEDLELAQRILRSVREEPSA